MPGQVTIAVDSMGGDHGPSVATRAVISSIRRHPDLKVLLVGDVRQLRTYLPQDFPEDRITLVDAPDYVRMDDRPAFALRHKMQSSMAVTLQLVRDGRADACVSAGNTGALMALGRAILKMPNGIERPAIIKRIPAVRGRCYLLDLGANVDCTAEHLYQFALLGSLMVEAVERRPRPRIALINVGEESIKGNEQVRLAGHLLSSSPHLNYIGYVEGDAIFKDVADVVVCDGFVGNVAIKAGEGLIEMLGDMIRQSLDRGWHTRLLGMLLLPLLRPLQELLDPATHNGASLIGLNGIVVKSHGAAREKGFARAIEQSMHEARLRLPEIINSRLDELIL